MSKCPFTLNRFGRLSSQSVMLRAYPRLLAFLTILGEFVWGGRDQSVLAACKANTLYLYCIISPAPINVFLKLNYSYNVLIHNNKWNKNRDYSYI